MDKTTHAFGSTFAFLPTTQSQTKNAKELPSQRTANRKDSATLTQQTFVDREARTANHGIAAMGADGSN